MVYLYSVIAGFKAILGGVGIQLALFISVFFFVRAPNQPYTDPTNIVNQALYEKLWWVKVLMLFTHATCVVAIVLPQFLFNKRPLIWQTVTIFAMIMAVINITVIFDCKTKAIDEDLAEMTLEDHQFSFFMAIEIVVFISILAANMIFLFFRAISDQSLTVKVP